MVQQKQSGGSGRVYRGFVVENVVLVVDTVVAVDPPGEALDSSTLEPMASLVQEAEVSGL